MRLPDGSTYLGFGWLPFGFYNGPKRAPIRGTGWHFGLFGWRHWRRYERYWRHVAFGVYIRWPAASRLITKAITDQIWGGKK